MNCPHHRRLPSRKGERASGASGAGMAIQRADRHGAEPGPNRHRVSLLAAKLSLRDLAEMFLIRGLVFTHEAVRDWEAKLAPLLAEGLRKRRAGNGAGTSMKRTSRSPANGAICTGRSTATAT